MAFIDLVYDRYSKITEETQYGMMTSFDDQDSNCVSMLNLSLEEAVHNFFIYGGARTISYLKQYEGEDQVIYIKDFYYVDIQFDMDSEPNEDYDSEITLHIRCDNCGGDGNNVCSWCTGSGNGAYGGECNNCEGNGYIRCRSCDGVGYY